MRSKKLASALVFGFAIAILCGAAAGAAPDKCKFSVVSGVSFGNYNVLSAFATTANGTISYSCEGLPAAGGLVNISLSQGNSPTFAPRYMLNGVQQLTYNLYLDAGLNTIWGDGTGGTSDYGASTLNDVLTTLTVYGQIPAGQDVGAGSYSDNITATMTW